jgi:hypothetical protein
LIEPVDADGARLGELAQPARARTTTMAARRRIQPPMIAGSTLREIMPQ